MGEADVGPRDPVGGGLAAGARLADRAWRTPGGPSAGRGWRRRPGPPRTTCARAPRPEGRQPRQTTTISTPASRRSTAKPGGRQEALDLLGRVGARPGGVGDLAAVDVVEERGQVDVAEEVGEREVGAPARPHHPPQVAKEGEGVLALQVLQRDERVGDVDRVVGDGRHPRPVAAGEADVVRRRQAPRGRRRAWRRTRRRPRASGTRARRSGRPARSRSRGRGRRRRGR